MYHKILLLIKSNICCKKFSTNHYLGCIIKLLIHKNKKYTKTQLKEVAAIIAIFTISFSLANARGTVAEGGMGMTHEQEVAQGGMLYQKIQAKEMSCADLRDADFELMGEYFMEQNMPMADHDMMNDRLKAMMGDEGEEMVHMNIGKHGSKCDTAADAVGATGTNMMGEHAMNGMEMDTHEDNSFSNISAEMLLLWIFALIGFFSIIKMVVVSAQKKVTVPTGTEVKK